MVLCLLPLLVVVIFYNILFRVGNFRAIDFGYFFGMVPRPIGFFLVSIFLASVEGKKKWIDSQIHVTSDIVQCSSSPPLACGHTTLDIANPNNDDVTVEVKALQGDSGDSSQALCVAVVREDGSVEAEACGVYHVTVCVRGSSSSSGGGKNNVIVYCDDGKDGAHCRNNQRDTAASESAVIDFRYRATKAKKGSCGPGLLFRFYCCGCFKSSTC